MSQHFLKIILPYIIIIISTFIFYDVSWLILLYVLSGYLFIGVIGNMIGYHRYLSHKSFKLKKILHNLISYLGVLSGQGSPLFWVSLHRHHHRYSDTHADIHSPKLGLWESTIKWQIFKTSKFTQLFWPKDLMRDKWLMLTHKHYYFIYWTTFIILALISIEFAVGFMLIGGTLIMTILDIIGNYIMHTKFFGSQDHITNDNSTNVKWFNLFVFGSGYHNNHHSNPNNYRFSNHDFSANIIDLIKIKDA